MSSLRAVRLLVKLGVVVTRRTPPRRARAARFRAELAAPSRPPAAPGLPAGRAEGGARSPGWADGGQSRERGTRDAEHGGFAKVAERGPGFPERDSDGKEKANLLEWWFCVVFFSFTDPSTFCISCWSWKTPFEA